MLMSRLPQLVLTILGGAIFILLFVLISQSISRGIGEGPQSAPTAQRHFAFYLPSFDAQFFSQVEQGAQEAAESIGAALSFHEIDSPESGFDYAYASGFAGVAVYPYGNQEDLLSSMEKVVEAQIPLVFIENELNISVPAFFIGTNSYDTGRAFGRLARGVFEPEMHIVLVYSEKNPGLLADANLVEMGFSETLGPESFFLRTERTGLNPLHAERLSYEIVQDRAEQILIVLTDLSDTLLAAQAIIDMNLVGQVRLIGFGDNDTVRDYIQKGILEGSVARNPYRIGYSTVMALQEIAMNGYSSSYVSTGVEVLTASTIAPAANGSQRP